MPKNRDLKSEIIKSLEKDPYLTVKDLSNGLKMNRTFLAGYLEALEKEGYIKLREVGPAKLYFNNPAGRTKRG